MPGCAKARPGTTHGGAGMSSWLGAESCLATVLLIVCPDARNDHREARLRVIGLPPMSAIAHLRAATWPAHQKLEKRVDVKARFATREAYRGHLVKLWGFHAAVEGRIGRDTFGAALEDYDRRLKAPLLARDLVDLGLAATAIDRLPRCESVPDIIDTSAAFGCIYVLEGATLGGRTLLPLAETRLGLRPGAGATYLSSYGEEVTPMWQTFGSALDAWCSDPGRRDRATEAAVATFDALDAWFAE